MQTSMRITVSGCDEVARNIAFGFRYHDGGHDCTICIYLATYHIAYLVDPAWAYECRVQFLREVCCHDDNSVWSVHHSIQDIQQACINEARLESVLSQLLHLSISNKNNNAWSSLKRYCSFCTQVLEENTISPLQT